MLAEICAYSSNFLDFFSISEIYMKNQIMMCMHPNNNYILFLFFFTGESYLLQVYHNWNAELNKVTSFK